MKRTTYRSRSLFKRAGEWLDNYWGQLFAFAGSIFLALAGILPGVKGNGISWVYSTWYGRLFLLGFVVSLVGWFVSVAQLPGIRTLEKEVERLDNELSQTSKGYSEIFNGELSLLSDILKFTNDERISVYKHNKQAFVMIGRYSSNPNYSKSGRVFYPDNQGCIGQAWAMGESFVDDLPETETRWYQKVEKDWSIPQNTARNISMKSKTIAAFAIRKTSISKDNIGVIVFESINCHAFTQDSLKQQLELSEEKRLALLIEKTEPIQPTPSYALKEGY